MGNSKMTFYTGSIQPSTEKLTRFFWTMAWLSIAGAPLALAGNIGSPVPEKSNQYITNLLRCGISKHRLGDDRAAEGFFKDALEIDHENANALFNLGVIAEQRGDFKLALKDYQAALKANPNDQDLQAAIQQVERSMKAKQAGSLSEHSSVGQTFASSDSMPPTAPSFALALPSNRSQYQNNFPAQNAAYQQLPNQGRCQAGQPFSQTLMRTALGVARLMNHDTCSLCGGLLRRW